MEGVETRLATLDDVAQLVRLRRQFTYEDESGEARPEYEDECRAFLHSALTNGRWRVWVACVGTRIISHLYVALIEKVPRPTRPNQKIAYLTNVYTVPEFRNRGVGGRLLAVAHEAAADDRAELVIVWPSDENVGFYARQGFRSERDPLVWEA